MNVQTENDYTYKYLEFDDYNNHEIKEKNFQIEINPYDDIKKPWVTLVGLGGITT